jgi:hypothetical protein
MDRMQTEQPKPTVDTFRDTVTAYCCRHKRWFNPEELEPLLIELVKVWSGSYTVGVEVILGKGKRSATYGSLAHVLMLPFPQALDQYPEISKKLARDYGSLIMVSGNGYPGIELYFVDRNALALNDALERFSALLNLKTF